MDLDEAASRLYAMPLDQFIPTRTALVSEARAAREPDLATSIGTLRKPSVAAWLVNQLARLDPAPLSALTALGDRLREAQSTLDGTALRELARQRSDVVDEAMARVSSLAADRGVAVSPGVSTELHDTFVAALATAEAGAAVRSGRLVRALSYAGFGDVDLDHALAGSAPSMAGVSTPEPGHEAAPSRRGGKPSRRGGGPSAAEVKAAERRQAQRDKAEALVASRREELRELEERQQAAEAHIGELEQQLEEAQAALVRVVGRKGKAQRALREAEAALSELP
jgi:hypothetical protein